MIPAPASGPASAVVTSFGELCAVDPAGRLRVRLASGESVEARRAVGCLVEPAAGDRVLVAGAQASEEWYVLTVLDRESKDAALTVAGDLTVASRTGTVRVLAAADVEAVAGGAVRLAAPELGIEAGRASLAVRALEYAGDRVRAHVERVHTVATFIDTQAERWSQRVDRCIRFVREMDLLRAKQVDHAIEEGLHLRARHAFVQANQVVKIDGDQIQLG